MLATAAPARAITFAPQSGPALYQTYCSSCHGAKGLGSSVAPSIAGKPAVDVHLMMDTGRMPAAIPGDNDIHNRSVFTQEQIDRITAYVMTFEPHGDPALPVVYPGNAARGHELFAQNCAPCHGIAGSGDSVGYRNVAPSLDNATVFEVAEAIRAGPGVMPSFDARVLSDRDVGDIERYVNVLQTQAGLPTGLDAGGFSLAHVGPAAEGAIGWLAFGVLVFFIRRIGSAGPQS